MQLCAIRSNVERVRHENHGRTGAGRTNSLHSCLPLNEKIIAQSPAQSSSKWLFRYVCSPQLRLTRYASCGRYRGRTYCTRIVFAGCKTRRHRGENTNLSLSPPPAVPFNPKKSSRSRERRTMKLLCALLTASPADAFGRERTRGRGFGRARARARERFTQLYVLFDQCIARVHRSRFLRVPRSCAF